MSGPVDSGSAAPRHLRPVTNTGSGTLAGAAPGWQAEETRQFWLWAAALLLVCLLGLGRAPLFDVDEGAFSEASREMVTSGDWLHTTLNGNDRFDKPIGVYWLQASSLSLFGVNEFAVRLPSALCTWAWALALALFAWPRWGLRTGLLAGTLLATSLGLLLIGRAATADALLNLLICLAALDVWRWIEAMDRAASAGAGRAVGVTAPRMARAPSGEARIAQLFAQAADQEGTERAATGLPAGRSAAFYLRRVALWIGLGLLVKGPVAVLVPGAALLCWSLFARRWRLLLEALKDPWAWAILVTVAAPWYAYALHRHGQAFIDGFFIKHNLSRYSGAMEGHGGSFAYYLVLLPVLLLPWAPLLGPLVWRPGRVWAEALPRYLLLWGGFVLLFFSFSGTKLPHYVLYGAAPFVLLMARWLGDLDELWPRRRRPRLQLAAAQGAAAEPAAAVPPPARPPQVWMAVALYASMGGLLGLAALLPLLLPRIAAGQGDALYRALLGAPVEAAALWASLALAAAAVLALALWPGVGAAPGGPATAASGPSRLLRSLNLAAPSTRLALAGVVTALALLTMVIPWWGERLQGEVKQMALAARAWRQAHPAGPGTPGTAAPAIVQWRLHQPSFALYLGEPTHQRPPQAGELALVRLDRLPPSADAVASAGSAASASAAAPWQLLQRGRAYGLLLWTGSEKAPS